MDRPEKCFAGPCNTLDCCNFSYNLSRQVRDHIEEEQSHLCLGETAEEVAAGLLKLACDCCVLSLFDHSYITLKTFIGLCSTHWTDSELYLLIHERVPFSLKGHLFYFLEGCVLAWAQTYLSVLWYLFTFQSKLNFGKCWRAAIVSIRP